MEPSQRTRSQHYEIAFGTESGVFVLADLVAEAQAITDPLVRAGWSDCVLHILRERRRHYEPEPEEE